MTGSAVSLGAYFAKLATLQAKHTFSLCLALDLFSGTADGSIELAQLLAGEIVVPLPVYVAWGRGTLPAKVAQRWRDGEEVCENVRLLGTSSLAGPAGTGSYYAQTSQACFSSRRASESLHSRALLRIQPTRIPRYVFSLSSYASYCNGARCAELTQSPGLLVHDGRALVVSFAPLPGTHNSPAPFCTSCIPRHPPHVLLPPLCQSPFEEAPDSLGALSHRHVSPSSAGRRHHRIEDRRIGGT